MSILMVVRELISRGLWVLVAIGAGIGTLSLIAAVAAQGAPQQGAGAAMAAACVVLPYTVARAFDEITRSTETK